MPTGAIKIGAETRVNSVVEFTQDNPAIAALSGGGYVVSWRSWRQDTFEWGTFAKQFNASGTPVGSEFLVPTQDDNWEFEPTITALDNGGYVIAWAGWQDGSGYGVYTQIYGASGAKVGGEVLVNTTTLNSQRNPHITTLDGGGYIVVWESFDSASGNYDIFSQRYSASGAAQGGETAINTTTVENQAEAAVTALNGGGYVVVWTSDKQDSSANGVYIRLFDATGAATSGEILVNTNTSQSQDDARIVTLANGKFIVVWSSFQQIEDRDIFGQIFNADGTKSGTEFLINTVTKDEEADADIAVLADGGFVVTWTSSEGDDDLLSIVAQVFADDGTKIGDEFLVNTTTADLQTFSQVAGLADGNFVVTWASRNQDDEGMGVSSTGVYSQHFVPASFGDSGANSLVGDGQDNWIYGLSGNDTIDGNGGNDTLIGDVGNDSLIGGLGNDLLVGDAGSDSLLGGDGSDTLQGGEGSDNLRGEAGADVLSGGDGNDVLNGGDGEDLLFGGAGHDLMFGGGGFDRLFGGAGVDRIFGGNENDIANGGADNDIINTGSGNDLIFAQNGNDLVFAQAGNDNVFGGAGNDRIFGGIGNDEINAGDDNDEVFGGAGIDLINGAGGNDTMSGGGDSDTFLLFVNQGDDRITDYTGTDRLDISSFGVTDGAGSDQDWRDATTSVGTSGGGSNVTIAWDDGGTLTIENIGIASLTDVDFVF